jgi:hypothetical protein
MSLVTMLCMLFAISCSHISSFEEVSKQLDRLESKVDTCIAEAVDCTPYPGDE